MNYLFHIILFILFIVFMILVNVLTNYNTSALKFVVRTVSTFQVQLQYSTVQVKFQSYVKKFNKSYTDVEFQQRLKNFRESLEEISRFNELHGAKVFGQTKFSDWSTEEFKAKMLSGLTVNACHNYHSKCHPLAYKHNNTKYDYVLPPKVDWREHGDVFPVLNQRRCQACWAFSIVGAMESRAAIHGKRKVKRSIQELIDCSKYNKGCDRGDFMYALDYLCSTNLAVVTEEEYPLTLRNESCLIDEEKSEGLRIAEFTHSCNVREGYDIHNVILREVAQNGPVVTGANSSPWRNYIDGVIQAACSGTMNDINHAVQIVGYDLTHPVPHYIIRNSWGEDFGDHGYIRLAIGGNVCGIANKVAYFTLQ